MNWKTGTLFAVGLAVGVAAGVAGVASLNNGGEARTGASPTSAKGAPAAAKAGATPVVAAGPGPRCADLAPLLAKGPDGDGRESLQKAGGNAAVSEISALLLKGKEAAAGERPRDAEILFIDACRKAQASHAGDLPAADAQYQLARHYANAAAFGAARPKELYERANRLYSASLQIYTARHGASHERTKFAREGLITVQQVTGVLPPLPEPAVARAKPAAAAPVAVPPPVPATPAAEDLAKAAAQKAQAERAAQAERVAQAERAAQAERVAQAERAAQAERVAQAERAAQAERVAQAERAAQAERVAQAERAAQAERVAQAERTAQAERVAQAERAAQAERVAQAERAAQAERVARAERAAQAERVAQAQRAAQAERVAQAERAQAERALAARAQAERVQAAKAQAEKAQAERALAAKVLAEKAQAERAQAERAQVERALAARAQAERVQAARAQAEKAQAERALTAKVLAEKALAERAQQKAREQVAALPAPETRRATQPSFNCAQARSITEKLICGDEELARLDRDLGRLHQRAKEAAPDRRAFQRASDAEWKQREATCRDRECLRNWYAERRQELSAAADAPRPVARPAPVVVRAPDRVERAEAPVRRAQRQEPVEIALPPGTASGDAGTATMGSN